MLIPKSVKQKINTTSSTVAEYMGCSNYVPSATYSKLFLSEQGYAVKLPTIKKEHEINIRLLINGRKSRGKKLIHIDIRYFFNKDLFDRGEYNVDYYPN